MAEPQDDDTTGDATDGRAAQAPRPEGRIARLERMLAPTPPPPTTRSGGAVPTKWSIDRLDGRERLYCYAASVVAVVFAVLVYVGQTSSNYHPGKGHLAPSTSLIVSLAFALLLAGTTWIGRRALAGFASLFAFFAFGTSALVIGLPFLVLAGWLLLRSYKVQKEATAALRAERRTTDDAPARSARSPRSAAASGRGAAEARTARKKTPTGPEGNKRYTPKKPAPRPVPAAKPSWRERRAAKTSD